MHHTGDVQIVSKITVSIIMLLNDLIWLFCVAGDLPAESAVLSNDHQLEFRHSERLGSMTPSISHSVAPGSLDIYHPCKVGTDLCLQRCEFRAVYHEAC